MKKSDIWSIGIITYLLVSGTVPFNGRNNREIANKIKSTPKTIPYPKHVRLTKSCRHFIESLLCDDTTKRLSASEALQHEWISGNAASEEELSGDYLNSLKKYKYGNKLQKILVTAILDDAELDEQKSLNQGVLELNRRRSQMDVNQVVNYLLLNSANKEPEQQLTKLKLIQQLSEKVEQRRKQNSHFDPDMNWDSLDGLDVDLILDQIEESEKQNEVEQIEHLSTDISDDKVPPFYDMCSIDSTLSVDSFGGKSPSISVAKFKRVLSSSSKKYNVEKIVDDLHNGDGQIVLDDISTYHINVETMDDVSELYPI